MFSAEVCEPLVFCCVVVLAQCFELSGDFTVAFGSYVFCLSMFFEFHSEFVDFLLPCPGFVFGAHGSLFQDGVSPIGHGKGLHPGGSFDGLVQSCQGCG